MTSSRQHAPHSGGKGSAVPPAAAAAAEQQEGRLGRHGLVDRTQYIRLLEQVCKYSAVRPCIRPLIAPFPSRLSLPSCGWLFTAQQRRSSTPCAVKSRRHCCCSAVAPTVLRPLLSRMAPPHPTAQAVRSLGFGEVAEQLERASGVSSQPRQVQTACCTVRGSFSRCLAAALGRSPMGPQPDRPPRAPLCSTQLLARCAALSAGGRAAGGDLSGRLGRGHQACGPPGATQ